MVSRNIYLVLSLISGVIEIGGILYLVQNGFSLFHICLVALCYQIGNMVPVPISLSRRVVTLLSIASLLGYLSIYYGEFSLVTFCFSYSLAGIVVQSLRSSLKGNSSTTIKRCFRVTGFILSPLFSSELAIAIGLLTLVISLANNRNFICSSNQIYRPKVDLFSMIMIVHQVHYFIYCYGILYYLSIESSNLWTVGIVFSLGWLTYVSMPHVLKGKTYFYWLSIGHLFLSIILYLMSITNNYYLMVILWVITGIGGGTVFCINQLWKSNRNISNKDNTFAENIGHVIGVMLAVVFASKGLHFSLLISSAFTIITVILTIMALKDSLSDV